MHSLLRFIQKHSNFLLFLLLEILAVILIARNNEYPRSVFFSSANNAAAKVYNMVTNITDYFHLKEQNQALNEENTQLKNQLLVMENLLDTTKLAVTNPVCSDKNMVYIPARVINGTTGKSRNYLTLNKGEADGIGVDMGVVDKDGVIGIVCTTSTHFSIVIPIINQTLSVSCKTHNCTGPLCWDAIDYRYAKLNDIPKHIEVLEGDSLYTSGYAAVFPAGIFVGTIDAVKTSDSDAYHNIRVKLASNFRKLDYVQVIYNKNQHEQHSLENSVK